MRSPRFLFACLLSSFATFWGAPTYAQITPDQTLGSESSVVVEDIERQGILFDVIDGGARREENLFHSFLDFNVGEFKRVFFFNPEGVNNIFSRVTGDNISNINGILGTFGDGEANLYLINPNGIFFGENAFLDLQGSFTATTATGVELGHIGFFGDSEFRNDSLLSVQPSAFFFSNLTEKGDINILSNGTNFPFLRVPNGNSLQILGRNVFSDGGYFGAWGGRVEIGAVGEEMVTLSIDDNSIVRNNDFSGGEIFLDNGSLIDVQLNTGGNISFLSNEIKISQSQLLAGIESGFGDIESKAGDIILHATDYIGLSESDLRNNLELNATGQAGNLRLTANTIDVINSSQIDTRTLGIGNSGDVIIQAQNRVFFSDESVALSIVDRGGTGESGSVLITAGSLEVLEGSQISAATLGEGGAGNIVLDIQDNILLDGISTTAGFPGGITSRIDPSGTGQGGDIQVAADRLTILNGSQISAATLGEGDAGNIVLDIRDHVLLDGISTTAGFPGGITSRIDPSGTGQGGDIQVAAGSLYILNGSQISAATAGNGNAGNIILSVQDSTVLDGMGSTNGFFSSGIFSSVNPGARGQGGDVRIDTGSLNVLGDSLISAATSGEGDAGDVNLNVQDFTVLDGMGSTDGFFPGGIFSSVDLEGRGQGGNIRIDTGSLSVLGDSRISAETAGNGDAGSIDLTAQDTVHLEGMNSTDNSIGGIFSSVSESGAGRGGTVNLRSNSVVVSDDAQISAATFGIGDAGSIETISNNVYLRGGTLSTLSESPVGNAGQTTVVSEILQALDGNISASSDFTENGRIQLSADIVILEGDSDIQSFAYFGSDDESGGVFVVADALVALDDSDIISFTSDGQGGNLLIDNVYVENPRFSQIGNDIDLFNLVDGNAQPDFVSTGSVNVSFVDVPFENTLTDLSESFIDTETLISNVCTLTEESEMATFTTTGRDRLPQTPSETTSTSYPVGTVQSIQPSTEATTITEPQAIYQLEDGRLLMSRDCQQL